MESLDEGVEGVESASGPMGGFENLNLDPNLQGRTAEIFSRPVQLLPQTQSVETVEPVHHLPRLPCHFPLKPPNHVPFRIGKNPAALRKAFNPIVREKDLARIPSFPEVVRAGCFCHGHDLDFIPIPSGLFRGPLNSFANFSYAFGEPSHLDILPRTKSSWIPLESWW